MSDRQTGWAVPSELRSALIASPIDYATRLPGSLSIEINL